MSRFLLALVCLLTWEVQAAERMAFLLETKNEKQIWVADTDGRNPQPLTSGKLWHLYPEFDASGTKIVYVQAKDEKDSELILVDLAGHESPLVSGPGLKLHPDLSGNAKMLAYSAPRPKGTLPAIYVEDVTLEGKVSTRINTVIEPEGAAYFPALSSDGLFLVFQENVGKNKRVVYYDLTTQKSRVISPEGMNSMSPSLSFDDRWVAFTGWMDNNWEVFVYDLHTSKVSRVTKNCDRDLAPTFKADGSLVFSSAAEKKNLELLTIDFDSLIKEKFLAKKLLSLPGDIYSVSFSGEMRVAQSIMQPIPAPLRSSFGAVTVGDKVVVVGGHQGAEHTYPPESFSDATHVYDIGSDSWEEMTARPRAAHGFGLASHNDKVYAFGGFAYSADHKPKWQSLSDVDRYDVKKDEWETIGSMPRKRSSNVTATVGTKVYLIGGWDSTPRFEKDYDGVFHKEIDVFDLETETFSTLEVTLPEPLRRAFSGVVVGKKIYLVGGISEGASHFNLINNVTEFDTETLKFKELAALPFATFAPAAGVLGGKLMVFGGMYRLSQEDFVYVNHIFSLGFERGSVWENTGRFLTESKGFSQVVALDANRLGVLGGHSYQGENAPVDTFEVFEWMRKEKVY